MSGQPIVSVVLMPTNCYFKRTCLVCAERIDDEAVNAEVWSSTVNVDPAVPGEQRTGLVVCDRCLALTPEQRAERLRHEAEWHEERARELRHIAAHPPVLPTVAERREAGRAHEAAEEFARISSAETIQ